MNYIEILNKYNHPYGEEFKLKLVEFLGKVMGDEAASKYWTDLFSYDRMNKFLDENNIKSGDDELKFLEDNKYKYDGYIKSCQDLDGNNYKEIPKFITERLEFMAAYSHIMLLLRLHCIHELCEQYDIKLEGKELLDTYIIYTIDRWKDDKIYKDLHIEDYDRIINDKEYYNKIIKNLCDIGLEYVIVVPKELW